MKKYYSLISAGYRNLTVFSFSDGLIFGLVSMTESRGRLHVVGNSPMLFFHGFAVPPVRFYRS